MSPNPLAKTIMIQGTGSSAGKSFMVAAFCRILANKGYKVAPYKSQNMALNSFVTKDGHEIGTAQAMQAEASKIEPSVEMNPILLKPEGMRKSQIIVNGSVVTSMSATKYHDFKNQLKKVVEDSLYKLRLKNDYVIIEGAGSPVEMNLKANDIVNMFVAKLANAKVLIIGDIDKGGIFSSLIGTYDLLDPEEKSLVSGFIINKFRGDPALLGSGLDFIKNKTGISVLGVIPYDETIILKEEDSHLLESKVNGLKVRSPNCLVVGIIRLPYMSNFDEFVSLERRGDIDLRLVSTPEGVSSCHLLIIPGSKKTVKDLYWLRKKKLDQAILKRMELKLPLVAICGGYQMLSQWILDDHQIETEDSKVAGLGILNQITNFQKEKNLAQTKWSYFGEGGVFLNGLKNSECFTGYEIHFGTVEPLFEDLNQSSKILKKTDILGEKSIPFGFLGNSHKPILGTLIHGIFLNDIVTDTIINNIRKYYSLPTKENSSSAKDEKDCYDQLADLVGQNLKIEKIISETILSEKK